MLPAFDEIFPKTKKSETPSDEIPENILKYACYNAYVAYKAKDALTEKLESNQDKLAELKDSLSKEYTDEEITQMESELLH